MPLSNNFKYRLLNNEVDFTTDDFSILLMDTGFTFDIDAHEYWDDISADELASGNGYTTGGVTLANIVIAVDDANDRGTVTWDDVVWTAVTGSIGPTPGAVIIQDTGTASTSIIVGYGAFSSERTITVGNTLTISPVTVRAA